MAPFDFYMFRRLVNDGGKVSVDKQLSMALRKLYDTYGENYSDTVPFLSFKGETVKFCHATTLSLSEFVKNEPMVSDDVAGDCQEWACVKSRKARIIEGLQSNTHFTVGGRNFSYAMPMSPKRVFRSGYCYLNVLVAVSQYIFDENTQAFSDLCTELPLVLGAWPTCKLFGRALMWMLQKFPYLANIVVPNLSINHGLNFAHFSDQRGPMVGCHVVSVSTVRDVIMLSLDHDYEGVFIGGDPLVEAYRRLDDAIRECNTVKYPWLAFYKKVCTDSLLAGTLIMSPANLQKLAMWFDDDEGFRRVVATLETTVSDALLRMVIIKRAIKGVKLHFNSDDVERSVVTLHSSILSYLDNQDDDAARDLAAAARKFESLTVNKKMQFIYLETCIAQRTDYQWRKERNFGLLSCGESWCTMVLLVLKGWMPTIQKQERKAACEEIAMLLRCVWLTLFAVVKTGCFALTTYFTVKGFLFFLFKAMARYYLGSQFGHHLWMLLITCVALIVSMYALMKSHKPMELQAIGADKKVTGCIAFVVLAFHIFDSDVAMILSSSLHTVSRTAALLTDETRNLIPKLMGTQLQADDVEEIMELDIELDPEIAKNESLRTSYRTFQGWIDGKIVANENYTRELQYGGGGVDFIITCDNHNDIVDDMLETKKPWNSVVGGTGSGKSTRIPVHYFRGLKQKRDRMQRILVCEPSRATTANVAMGISQFYGECVYYKHRTREQTGFMGIQVMTYGSALMKALRTPTFLESFDAVFLDESHHITSHSLILESLLAQYDSIRKFYVSATPRVGDVPKDIPGRFRIQQRAVENTDPNFFLKEQGSGSSYDVTNLGPVILCFVQGRKQADTLALKVNTTEKIPYKGYSLHADNFDVEYNKIVRATNENERVMIFCTNILETGVTLSADCVVDFGFTMRPVLSMVEKRCQLMCSRVTKFERLQRIGRVGRIKDGVAIVCGKVAHGKPPVSPDVVYEAALYSFLYDLDLYTNETLDTHHLATVTKAQAEGMLCFDLPVFVMRDLVDRDGSMHGSMVTALKKHIVGDMQITTRDVRVAADKWGSWPNAHDLVMMCLRGSENDDIKRLGHEKIPFCSYHLLDLDLDEFVKACSNYEPYKAFESIKVKGLNKRVMLRIDPENVNICHSISKALYNQQKDILASLMSMHESCKESKLMHCFKQTRRFLNDHQKRIEVTKANMHKIQVHISKLERYESFIRDNEVPGSFSHSDFRTVFDHMNLQSSGDDSKPSLLKMLDCETNNQLSISDLFLHHGDRIAVGLLVASGAYVLSQIYALLRSATPVNHYSLEGKGKPYRNRDKRSEAIAINESFDFIERLKKEKSAPKGRVQRKEQPDFVSSLLKKTQPFVNFYDINDQDVEKAIFKTLDGKILHETSTPVDDVRDLENVLSMKDFDATKEVDWANMPLDGIDRLRCEITLKDGRQVHVAMGRHQHNQLTRTGSLMGYPERHGEFRQMGSTKLELKSTQPFSSINSDCLNMVGLVYVNGKPVLNAIVYGDFIICPAHVKLLGQNLTFRFKHATATITVHDHMAFQQCDLILIRRPNVIAPVAAVSKCAVLYEPSFVQLAYRDTQNMVGILSPSDMCTPFDNGRWTYTISTRKGMCGAAVVCVKTGCFVGIHVSANEIIKRNFMEPFSADMVSVLKKQSDYVATHEWKFDGVECGYLPGELSGLQSHQPYQWLLQFEPSRYTIEAMNDSASGWGRIQHFHPVTACDEAVNFTLSGGFELLGKSTSNLCSKHKIVGLSPYWEEFKSLCPQLVSGISDLENHYAPSALNREAYYKDISKFNRELKCFCDIPRLETARHMVIEDLVSAGMTASIIPTAEQVLADLDVNTAAGALYACKKKLIFKNWPDGALLGFASECFSKVVTGENVGVWNGSLKDELRPVEKVLDNKTRVFTAAPITTLIGGKFFVDDFNKKFYQTHLKARHTVGINPWGGGWNRLAQFLGGRDMPLYISGDGSRFDSSIDPILFDQVLKIRSSFFGDNEQALTGLKNLYHEIVYTPILLENGQIVMKKVGNNSGQPSTVVDNTLVLMMCFYYCALAVSDDGSWIRENFLFVCNGDDQKCAVTQAFIDVGGVNFEHQLKQCGLTYEFDEPTTDITMYPYMSLTMVPQSDGCVGFLLHPERITAINQWMIKKGILGVAQRAFAAMVLSYNDKWLFSIMHAYLCWILLSYEHELVWAIQQTGETVTYMNPDIVHLAHFGGTVLQVDSSDDDQSSNTQQHHDQTQHHVDDEPVAGMQVWHVPRFSRFEKSSGFRKLGGKYVTTRESIKTIPRDVCGLMRNDVATDNQFLEWAKDVKSEYSINSDQEWTTVLMAWCLFCAHNGTTDKFRHTDVMPIPNGRGSTDDVQIGGFVKCSKQVGLRKIMRKMSRETSQMLQQIGEITKWGHTHGIHESWMIPYAFDFYIEDVYTPPGVHERLASVKHSALGKGSVDALLLDNKHHDLQTVSRPRNPQGEPFRAPEV